MLLCIFRPLEKRIAWRSFYKLIDILPLLESSVVSAKLGKLNLTLQYQMYLFCFQDLCRMNNQLLIALGVGHPKIDQICTSLARYGIHPKMTGAGGGGSVYAFLKPGTAGNHLSAASLS